MGGSDIDNRALVGGRYELLGEIGRGSTGTVWEACDRESSSVVALKLFHRDLPHSAPMRRRFLREVEAASTLRHPHSVEIRSHGYTTDGRPFLVMERLTGISLATCLREHGALPQGRAIKIISEILEAAGAAHRAHVIHRDLKPANVMLIDRGDDRDFVKVCDFGLAKPFRPDELDDPQPALVDDESITTDRGEMCGTPEYMAPEQARGERVDVRADIYSVGVMLYQAVVGHLPFRDRSRLAVVSMHLNETPRPPSVARPDLGIFPPLENLIMRALAKDPADRPCSADVFHAELLQIGRDHARRAGAGERPITAGNAATLPGARRTPIRRLVRTVVNTGALAAALAGSSLAFQRHAPPALPPLHQLGAPRPPGATPLLPPRTIRETPTPPSAQERVPASPRRSTRGSNVRTSLRSDRGEGLLRGAEAQLRLGRITEACALAERAAREAPGRADPWEFLGRCYMRSGDLDRARASYRRYLALAPHAPHAVFVRAILDQEESP